MNDLLRPRPNLCSLRGVCSFDAHPLINLLCLPIVLVFHTITIYVIPLITTYCSRLLRFLAKYIVNILTCIKFTDSTFPPSSRSLGNVEDLDISKVVWVRASELDPSIRSVLFDKKINPGDLMQGRLGDCWLVAALANLAEYPAAIRNTFVNLERTARGKYSVRIFDPIKKEWQIVVIDDFIPVTRDHQGKFKAVMMTPHGPEMWAILLEKALAKYCGSYNALTGGSAGWAWHVLTGDPVFCLEKSSTGNEYVKNDLVCSTDSSDPTNRRFSYFLNQKTEAEKCHTGDLFGVLQAYLQRRCPVSASILKSSPNIRREEGLSCGLMAGHAYSVLEVRRAGRSISDTLVDTHKSGFTLVKLRNPWGSGEWNGMWSDNCPLWKLHPQIAKEVGFVKAEDGVFWVDITDFWKYFDRIQVCDRSTKKDLRLNPYEEIPVFGPFYGFLTGIFKFWCLCRGIRVIYCGQHPSDNLKMSDGKCGCVPPEVKDTLRGASREIKQIAVNIRHVVVHEAPPV